MEQSQIFEILSSYNRFWSGEEIEAGIKRDLLPSCLKQVNTKEILVLKGVRRSGKSTLLLQIVQSLLQHGVNAKNILWVNLEEPLFSAHASMELLEQIYRTWRERICPEGKGYLFLDEVQNIPDWERWVRGRNDSEDIKIFVTGSSARMLSREIGSKLTGRQVSFEVYPLSFAEYLRFQGVTAASDLEYVNQKALIRHLFFEYLQFGGFPEVVLKDASEDKKLLLKNYFDDILHRDIVARHEIRDVANLHNLAVYLLTNNARRTSVNKIKANFSISQDKAENYLSAILESYLVFQVRKFEWSLKKVQRAGFKPYAIDTGLRNRVAFSFSTDRGWLAENVVHNHLRRASEDVFFAANDQETDFVIKEGMHIAKRIQVWFEDSSCTHIPERELAAFTDLDANSADCLLITNDLEMQISTGAVTVQCIPIIKYLLFAA